MNILVVFLHAHVRKYGLHLKLLTGIYIFTLVRNRQTGPKARFVPIMPATREVEIGRNEV
jgi:hypothetical protein